MRKPIEQENLECANCAAKMERDISAFPEVKKCTITFMTSRMSITIVDGADLDDVLDRAQKVMRSYEKDCAIVRLTRSKRKWTGGSALVLAYSCWV